MKSILNSASGTFIALISFLVILSITFFLSNANIIEVFTPRIVCMKFNNRLAELHFVSDIVIFISYIIIGSALIIIYKKIKYKGFPFSNFMFGFGGFIFFCGLTHLMGVIDLYVTYYWIDGIIKLITGWFSIIVCLLLIKSFKHIVNIKTPKEYKELSEKYDVLLKKLNEK